MSLLELHDVVAGYGSGPDILRGLSLTVEHGVIKCIIGPNGAGKSTLLKVISGLIKPRDGKVIFKDQDISGLRPDQIIARGISFVPQERALFGDMTVRENMRMGGYIIPDKREVDRRVDEVFEQFPMLKQKASQRAKTLSGGQQQMLAMGRTLVLKPDLVMLDEPSLGLAPKIVDQVFQIVHQLRDSGITLMLIEQNAVKGLQVSDEGCVLDLGRTLFEDRSDAILGDPRIQELYLGKTKFQEKETA